MFRFEITPRGSVFTSRPVISAVPPSGAITSALALALMTVVSIALGWLVAGRVLRPLRTITAAARDISATNLHKRLALDGPNDELHQLGNTFDELLGRLEASFEAQRQFVANASHELRTPLARQRTVAEVALSDPAATVESLRESHERILAAGEQQERLIEALLTLAHSERGLAQRESFDLAALTNRVANSGPIIPSGDIDRRFEPFQRLDSSRATNRNGTGLGPSIAAAIARAGEPSWPGHSQAEASSSKHDSTAKRPRSRLAVHLQSTQH
jgi:signal transduction histidine kinase